MKILLLISAFNSLSQAIFTRLRDEGHQVVVTFFINTQQVIQEIENFEPEIIFCPFLKAFISQYIYEKYPTYIFHPGPIGDRGPSSLEYALRSETKEWGVVILRANELYDGGEIIALCDFKVRKTYKASLYRQEVVKTSLKALDYFFSIPKKIEQILNPIHTNYTTAMRSINWKEDATSVIIDKINLSDSFPGVLDVLEGIECYLYGIWQEDRLRGDVKEILAKRDGAICLGTKDGAVWISHLKEPNGFKLPATYVLKERIRGVKEERIPLLFNKSYKTFYEISVEKRDSVAYLCFNFHNGAMSAQQCIRLKYAFEFLKEESEVIVLVGGMDFFSNGIHLNILEDSKKQGEDGWSNINAMNDLIKSILEADEVVTVASLARNAGAGGVFMALACDYVVAKEDVVLNPHYKTLGLSGSEYHTYTLPKRVGKKLSHKLLYEALPISVHYAQKIGMVDQVYKCEHFYEELHQFCNSLYSENFIWDKQDNIEENKTVMESCKRSELEKMYPEFYEQSSDFHRLRNEFVYKKCPLETPERLKGAYFA
jgi:putative two-component system hydrogenase maturation factor HypX/HoxX